MLAGFGGLLLLLIFVFAEVEDLTDGWLRVRRDFDEVEPGLIRFGYGVEFAHDADVLTILVD
jgi:hypothetical protein